MEEWECSRCTLRNDVGAAACAACGRGRGAAPSASEASSGSDSDRDASGGSDDGDYEMATGMDGPDEAAHTVEIHVAKRKWEETEARRVKAREEAAARAGGAAAASFDEKKAAQAQIFTSQVRAPAPSARAPRGACVRARAALLPTRADPNPG
jgi:hypothetical protein